MIYEIVKTDAKYSDNVNWKKILPISLTKNDASGKIPYKTFCYLAYNDKGIFFRIESEDDKINCTMTGYNEPIYDEEVVELFFQSTDDKTHYMEFEWNAIGGVFSAEIYNDLKGNTTIDFTKENIIDSKVFAMPNGWRVQGFLPKELFKGELSGEWMFNAYRIKKDADNSQILMSYSNTIEDAFHRPFKFAKLKFN